MLLGIHWVHVHVPIAHVFGSFNSSMISLKGNNRATWSSIMWVRSWVSQRVSLLCKKWAGTVSRSTQSVLWPVQRPKMMQCSARISSLALHKLLRQVCLRLWFLARWRQGKNRRDRYSYQPPRTCPSACSRFAAPITVLESGAELHFPCPSGS